MKVRPLIILSFFNGFTGKIFFTRLDEFNKTILYGEQDLKSDHKNNQQNSSNKAVIFNELQDNSSTENKTRTEQLRIFAYRESRIIMRKFKN